MFIQENALENVISELASIFLSLIVLIPCIIVASGYCKMF